MSVHYDPMLCKVIVSDRDREHATARMLRALGELRIDGVRTMKDFLARLLQTPEWQAGRVHTRALEEELLPRLRAAAS